LITTSTYFSNLTQYSFLLRQFRIIGDNPKTHAAIMPERYLSCSAAAGFGGACVTQISKSEPARIWSILQAVCQDLS